MTTTEVLGALRRLEGERGAVRVESVYPTTADDLWAAVTDPERLARWLAVVEGDLRPGGAFTARFTSEWEGPGRIEVCEPPTRLLVTMGPHSADETVIEAVLEPAGDGTRLVVEERGIALVELHAHGAGWQTHLEDLGTSLTGGTPGPWGDRVMALLPEYRRWAG